jgi:hypothetical protein
VDGDIRSQLQTLASPLAGVLMESPYVGWFLAWIFLEASLDKARVLNMAMAAADKHNSSRSKQQLIIPRPSSTVVLSLRRQGTDTTKSSIVSPAIFSHEIS